MAEGDLNPGAPGNPGNPPAPAAPVVPAAAVVPQGVTINADMLGEFKDDPVFKPFIDKPVGDVLKSFKNAQSLVGGEKLVIPSGKLDTPENWNHVFDKLGRPKTADGYKVDNSVYPEGIKIDPNREKNFKAAAHYLGLLPWQMEGLYKWNAQNEVAAINAMNEAENKRGEKTGEALRKELGTKEKYEEYVSGANAALNRFGGAPQDVAAFIDKYGNDPLVIKTFGNVAKGMLEDAALRGDKSFNLLGENAPAMVKDIMTNKDNKLNSAYFDKKNPQHDYAVAEVTRLQELIHGNKEVKI